MDQGCGGGSRERVSRAYSFITRSSEYRYVYDNGKKLVGRYYVMFYLSSGYGMARVGITVSGKVGNAVVRNRAKRRTREALKLVLSDQQPLADIVFVALGRIADAPFDGLVRDMARLVKGVS